MKMLFCGKCFDIRSFTEEGTSCRCGNMRARWEDLTRGTVRVSAKVKTRARIIGMHNDFLHGAFDRKVLTNRQWRDFQNQITAEAVGYLFHANCRNSWACIIRVGDSNDVKWEEGSIFQKVLSIDGWTVFINESVEREDAAIQLFRVEIFSPDPERKKLDVLYGQSPEEAEALAREVIQKTIEENKAKA